VTEASPIIEPTDRSMPPETMTGVNREQAQLDAESRNLEEVAQREKIRRDRREEHDLAAERQQQHPFAVRKPPLAP
jgi:hypothetical protein